MALTKVSSDMVSPDPTNASNLSSGDVPLAQLGNAPATDTTTLEDDIALLGFKVAVNGSLAKYNLVDQTEDAFMDATGIDATASTGEVRDAANYYAGTSAAATGGTITTYVDGANTYRVHSFLVDGTFVSASTGSIDYLVVAGGGGAGSTNAGDGGGGGAGGMLSGGGATLTAGSHAITVGDGGAGSTTAANGVNGGQSSIAATWVSVGGGGGSTSNTAASAGGSGGGAGSNGSASGAGGSGTVGQGNAGGSGGSEGAGGGGAGVVGAGSGNGGNGIQNAYRTGANVYYAGGGGGGRDGGGTSGGAGGGGGGSPTSGNTQGTDGLGGGGGGSGGVSHGKIGGSGIIVIRYVDGALSAPIDMVLQSNSTTAETAPTKGDIVMTYTNGAGTATLNTDLTAEFSADNGSTWTSTTLVAQGSTGTHLIVSAHDVTRTSTSGTAMKYRVKTLNQDAAKETRIQAVSLGWS